MAKKIKASEPSITGLFTNLENFTLVVEHFQRTDKFTPIKDQTIK